MSFLLDTNVVSEWTRPRPDEGVVRWLAEVDEDLLFLSVITLAELRRGVERMTPGSRRTRLEDWLTTDMRLRFEHRVLAVDEDIADQWGRVVAQSEAIGRPIRSMDAFLAATAIQRDLTMVTRNVSDFARLGLSITNPWTS